jgi:signal transduction histidine kinase
MIEGGRFAERMVIAAFTVVVTSFVLSAGYSQYRVRDIDADALSIAHNAIPSIEHLSAARAQLNHLRELVQNYSGKLDQDNTVDLKIAQGVLARLEQEMKLYSALPLYPDEHEVAGEIAKQTASVDRTVEQWFKAVQNHGPTQARRSLENALLIAIDQLIAAIVRAYGINVDQTRKLALGIERVQTNGVRVLLALELASIAIAAVAASVAIRALRAYRSLLESHTQLLRERADELERFAGRVAHDILSPLSSVGLGLDVALADGIASPRASSALRRGQNNLKKVKGIVDGLLTFARSGAKPVPNAATEVQRALEDSREEWTRSAAEAGLELAFSINTGSAVACTEGVLTSLLENLVRNAIKYTGGGPLRQIWVRVHDETAAVHFEVEDTGPGLDSSVKDRVFEPYVRSPKASQPGIGLGLATVKRLVEAHGGMVGVRSEPGRGCTFWFRLPKASVPAEVPLGRVAVSAGPRVDALRH